MSDEAGYAIDRSQIVVTNATGNEEEQEDAMFAG